VVAAFDFDGTLTRGGSVWPFLVSVAGRGPVLAAGAALAGELGAAALLGGHHADAAKEALFGRLLAGRPAAETAAVAVTFGRAHYRRRARADVAARLEWHRRRGHRIVIVSASPVLYLAPVAEDLAVDGLVATALAVDEAGRLTGRYDGGNCRGPQKLVRVRRWIDQAAGPAAVDAVLWAYGNSAGDRELLHGADVGVDAGRLGPLGSLRGFPRLADLPA